MQDDDHNRGSKELHVDDDIEVSEYHYDPVERHALPASTPLAVVLPDQWGNTTETHYGLRSSGPGYMAQATFPSGGFVGLWAERQLGQPDEATFLCEAAGVRITWSPERLRARVTVKDTDVLVSGDGIDLAHFESILRSLRVLQS